MTIDELIERLEEYREELGGDTDVRTMTQHQWPFENEIAGLASSVEIAEHEDGPEEYGEEENDGPDPNEKPADKVVFIVEGRQRCYGNKSAWDVAY